MALILAVDDERLQLSLIRKTLERGGHTVIDMTDPEEVADRLKQTRVDALITDVMMPGMTGWELIEHLRSLEQGRYLPILVLSALNDVPVRVRALRLGACDFLDKPFNSSELLARVEGLIARTQEGFSAFQGHLEAYSAAEAAQHFEINKKTGSLELQSGDWRGVIEFEQGQAVSAEMDQLRGIEAIHAMLAFKQGTFHVRTGAVNRDPAITPDFSIKALILEAVWLEDELHRLQPFLPEDSRVLSVVDPCMKLWIPEKYRTLPIEPVWKFLIEHEAPTIQAMVEGLPYAPNRIRLATAHLWEHKMLKSTPSVLKQRSTLWLTEPLATRTDAFFRASRAVGFSADKLRLALVFGHARQKEQWMGILFPREDRRLTFFEVDCKSGRLLIDINLGQGSGYGHTLNSIRHSAWVLVFNDAAAAWGADHLTDIGSVVPRNARKILVGPRTEGFGLPDGWTRLSGEPASFEALLHSLTEHVEAHA